ncbi:hypothetical protein E2562_018232 [Oryza meyeriana var. granulata]|uniref:Uncharacterized protein n=1 Tax=Oryza meyeriana var. granulata TaxID=110450 RepID=A0A6G1CFS5_9ORYZ|nr:hypothetical protein E2562_018232 [Oryza meyeriana var. granulata]
MLVSAALGAGLVMGRFSSDEATAGHGRQARRHVRKRHSARRATAPSPGDPSGDRGGGTEAPPLGVLQAEALSKNTVVPRPLRIIDRSTSIALREDDRRRALFISVIGNSPAVSDESILWALA